MGTLQSAPVPEQLVVGGGVALLLGALAYNAQNQEQPAPGQPAPGEKPTAKKGKKKKAAAPQPPAEPSGTITPPALAQSAKLFTESQLNDSLVSESGSVGKKSKKKSKAKDAAATSGAETPNAVDSGAESASVAGSGTEAAGKKKKKKAKAKSPLAQSAVSPLMDDPSMEASTVDMGSSWTHVTSKRGKLSKQPNLHPVEGSDTGATTSITEESQDQDDEPEPKLDNVRTFAEKMLPKPRKTGVDDMLETPDYPQVARVMRVTSGADTPPQKPEGVSWGDYEDADELAEGDAEDDDGWDIVTSRKRTAIRTQSQLGVTSSMTSSTSSIPGEPPKLTKHQKQNIARREAQKEAKAEAEADRLERLAKHRKEQEKAKIDEMYKKSKKGTGGSKVGGGMTSSVQNGALVWE